LKKMVILWRFPLTETNPFQVVLDYAYKDSLIEGSLTAVFEISRLLSEATGIPIRNMTSDLVRNVITFLVRSEISKFDTEAPYTSRWQYLCDVNGMEIGSLVFLYEQWRNTNGNKQVAV
jgi:hypothetical protein